MSDVKVPKSMPAEHVVWAFRYGVATALMSRNVYGPIRRMGGAYVQAPVSAMRLADRVRREWVRRHPPADLRPYGPGGAMVCFPCAMATPEREADAKAAFGALLGASEAVSPVGSVIIGQPSGPQPFVPKPGVSG